ncbi:hypothetical protein [Novosphingobium sp. ST904]|uniref:hypothetical protein n=1 Tax=Novosphingobium sp. ST904 TaxID=1684385 RepID=UPI000A4CB1D5|nr:hypothetical protein [Novosphingobium sp. ST904]TCM37748.1 hypothetical protein EDF59_110144 [Novosphingobium sp. ST904]
MQVHRGDHAQAMLDRLKGGLIGSLLAAVFCLFVVPVAAELIAHGTEALHP